MLGPLAHFASRAASENDPEVGAQPGCCFQSERRGRFQEKLEKLMIPPATVDQPEYTKMKMVRTAGTVADFKNSKKITVAVSHSRLSLPKEAKIEMVRTAGTVRGGGRPVAQPGPWTISTYPEVGAQLGTLLNPLSVADFKNMSELNLLEEDEYDFGPLEKLKYPPATVDHLWLLQNLQEEARFKNPSRRVHLHHLGMLLNLPEEEMTKMQNWDRGRFQEPIRFQEHLLGPLKKLNLPATVAHFGLLLNLPEEARRRKVRSSGTSSRKAGESTGDG
ncbi:hypothetical protein pipiens_011068 [Culex pipiens pipiens]|uniref:Uncharacterized protein n=1 Tax=Culex pipiens pipiens TaxID=38569 RepID=A0ABD1D7Q8_CULPP